MPINSVERKVYFYRSHIGFKPDGSPKIPDFKRALDYLKGLSFSIDGRYLDEGESTLCCWVDQIQPNQRFRFARIRRAGLPLLEQGGKLTDLIIPVNTGLAETVHVVIFPNNIVGSDFNFYGPRIGKLGAYLHEKANTYCSEIVFEPLLRQNVVDTLSKLMDIRLLNLKIHASYASVVSQADSDLGAAFDAAQRAGDAEELEIILRPKRYSHESLAFKLLTAVKNLAHDSELKREAQKFIVKGVSSVTEKVEEVDLLSDHLVSQVQIIRQSDRGRALNSESAYSEIQKAYEALEQELLMAAGVSGV
jgi:hypothetical protein